MAAKLGANEIIANIIQLALEKLETVDSKVSKLNWFKVRRNVNICFLFFSGDQKCTYCLE